MMGLRPESSGSAIALFAAAQLTAWHLRGRVGIERMRFAPHMRAAGWLMLSGQRVHDAGTASAQQERCDRTPSARGSPCLPHAQMTGMGACAMRAQMRRQWGSGFRAAGGRHERCGVPLERAGAHRHAACTADSDPSEWSLAVQARRSLLSSVSRLDRGWHVARNFVVVLWGRAVVVVAWGRVGQTVGFSISSDSRVSAR